MLARMPVELPLPSLMSDQSIGGAPPCIRRARDLHIRAGGHGPSSAWSWRSWRPARSPVRSARDRPEQADALDVLGHREAVVRAERGELPAGFRERGHVPPERGRI